MMKSYILVLFFVLILTGGILADDALILPVEENNVIPTDNISILPDTPLPDNISILPAETPLLEPATEPNLTEEPTPAEADPEPSLFTTILNLFLNKISVISGEIVNFQAHLSYENSSPIEGAPVDFYVGNNKIATETTSNTGSTEVNWNSSNLPAGVYIVGVDYQGEGQLTSSHAQDQLTIQPKEESFGLLTGAAVTEEISTLQLPSIVTKNESCIDALYEEVENNYDTCYRETHSHVCSDEPINLSCVDNVERDPYPCVASSKMVTKKRNECHTIGYTIATGEQTLFLSSADYTCSFKEDNTLNVVCDNKYDGNGDGICTSGESCMQFVFDGRTITQTEKNSEEEFRSVDDSFVVSKASVEVQQ